MIRQTTFAEWSESHDKVCRAVAKYAQAKDASYVDALELIGIGMMLGQLWDCQTQTSRERLLHSLYDRMEKLCECGVAQ